ncbi:hypothetical protein GCM10007862_15480 [Dyella lipolytica]|nr:hypothetical protein GCM10007862_15480 [Dyella lipolytica]
MAYACAGTHRLDIARMDLPFRSQTVPVSEHALSDVRNDFHVFVPMERESAANGYLVIVPHDQIPNGFVLRISAIENREVVLRAQPAEVGMAQ